MLYCLAGPKFARDKEQEEDAQYLAAPPPFFHFLEFLLFGFCFFKFYF